MSGRIFHFNHNKGDYKEFFSQGCHLGAAGILGFSNFLFEDNKTGLSAFIETTLIFLLATQKKTKTFIARMDHENSLECKPELFQLVVYRLKEWLAERN